ncbi:nitroreductase family protein [Histomonas meleagridis]|uniref:nitroreductase family protein n=1 Tax=Histomonas meleagridis TaxID=135588 RepID=UPI00355987B3|nr:nitroreductase family protein [Histomonas meleagridis]KAH0802835.1 nitroreductase family protein [Histomonas meleagridis]
MISAIEARRSCRKFDTTKKIDHDTLKLIVDMALSSPTGVDAQSNDLYVVTKEEVNDRFAQCVVDNIPPEMKEKMGNVGPERIFYKAPAVIYIVPARKERVDCAPYDLGIICQNICLAAKCKGIDSVIIGFAQNAPAAEAKEILGLPNETTVLAVALGYAAEDWEPQPKELKAKVQWIE